MKLYHYYRSSAAYRVRIALNFKGIPWQTELVDLRAPASAQHTPEFRALNPQGLIPVVADGDTTITQSLAIIEYLEETHPQPPLLPGSAADRAQVRSLALAIACDIHPLGNLRVLNYLRSSLHADERSEEHTSELQSQSNLVCRLLLEKKKQYEHRQDLSLSLRPLILYVCHDLLATYYRYSSDDTVVQTAGFHYCSSHYLSYHYDTSS